MKNKVSSMGSVNSGPKSSVELSEPGEIIAVVSGAGFGRREFLQGAAAGLVAFSWPARLLAAPPAAPVQLLDGQTRSNISLISGPVALDILPMDRRTIWNPGIYGGIPPDSAQLGQFPNGVGPATKQGATLTPSGGDDRGAIQSALSAASGAATKASRRYVQLGAGRFNISSPLSIPSYVILRGTLGSNNARRTVINMTSTNVNSIQITGNRSSWSTMYQVQGTVVRGDSTLTLNTVAGLSVGDLIKLDHLSDGGRSGRSALIWNGGAGSNTYADRVTTTNMSRNWDLNPGATDAAVFGNSSLSFNRADYSSPNFNYQAFPDSPGEGGNSDRGWRHMSQTMEILEIDSSTNTITVFRSPTHGSQEPDADVSGSPAHMWFYRDAEVYRASGTGSAVEYAGLEDLSVWPNGNRGILFENSKFCWVQNVETNCDPAEIGRVSRARHIDLDSHTYRCEVKSCYVHNQGHYAPGGAYGINISGSEHYIHDNVSINHNKPVNLEASCGGNVIAYNFVDNAIIANLLAWNESGIGTHASFCHNELIEGNLTSNVTIDSTHGNNGFNVIFRNHLRGRNTHDKAPAAYNGQFSGGLNRSLMIDFLNWETTSIGNVCYEPSFRANNLITSGHSTTWDNHAIPRDQIYLCGHNGWTARGITRATVDDDFALSHLHYHLDYHYLNSGSSLSVNPENPESTLPPSLHRESAPDYFSGLAWPAIDPIEANFANQVKTLPAKARLDAGAA